ncbi:LysE family translocator [Polycladidibacter hongkongensis]|uniref:LysE family translocator n=1 Tax=Polycladidibacter hongkongensis TaxID=1647556 RepID=UPI00082D80EF|nr:LysE family translocator [Pseudovibrio hongkongensis]
MEPASIYGLAIFIIIMTGTPGPGNLTFMSLGATMGFRRTLPLVLAAIAGGTFLHLTVAFGLGHMFSQGGTIVTIMKLAGFCYMAWLAWRIINLSLTKVSLRKPPSFWECLFIHPLSPKTWAMSLSAYTSFLGENDLSIWQNTLVLSIGFGLGGLVFHNSWALAGNSLLKILGDGRAMQTVTIALAGLMLGVTGYSMV